MKNNRKFLTTGYDIVVFDCDSTLTGIEGVDLLAKKKGRGKEVETLTKEAMNGKMRFEDIFPTRLNLIKPKKEELDWLYKEYIKHQVEDAKEVVEQLQNLGKKVYIISGGYDLPVKKFAAYLGVSRENVFAVELKFHQNGNYLGYNLKNVLTKNRGKRLVLKRLNKLGSLIFVGDGATDLEAKDIVDLFVGFGGVICRPIVQKNADIFINFKSLAPILALAQGTRSQDNG